MPALVVGAVVLLAVAAVVLVRSTGRAGHGGSGRPRPQRVYAYTTIHFGQDWTQTGSRLVVMDGTRRIGRAPLGPLGTDPAFTPDGR